MSINMRKRRELIFDRMNRIDWMGVEEKLKR